MSKNTEPSSPRRGRRPAAPKAQLGTFLREYLEQHHLTGAEVARRLGVPELMIWRLIHGVTLRFRKINKESFAQALEFDELSRRQFFDLATKAGIVFAGVAAALAALPEPPRAPVQIRYRQLDLDVYQSAIEGWAAAMPRDPRRALEEVQRLQVRIKEDVPADTGDLRFARLRIDSSLLLAALQEAVLPWWKERPATVETYNELLTDVFRAEWARQAFPQAYAQLLLRRAILYREGQRVKVSEAQLQRVDEELLRRTQDPVILTAYYSQQVHTASKLATPSEWLRAIDGLRARVERLTTEPRLREELLAIVSYTIGVGYKSFMWNLRDATSDFATSLRRTYAEQAYHWLSGLHAGPGERRAVRHINLYHGAIADEQAIPELESAEIDALVWCDPEEAIRRALALQPKVEQIYPSIMSKLESNLRLAKRRLDAKADVDTPPISKGKKR